MALPLTVGAAAERRHVYGAFAAGRDDNPKKMSAGCQFYIVVNRDGLQRLDGGYTVYGQVFAGMEIAEAIVAVRALLCCQTHRHVNHHASCDIVEQSSIRAHW